MLAPRPYKTQTRGDTPAPHHISTSHLWRRLHHSTLAALALLSLLALACADTAPTQSTAAPNNTLDEDPDAALDAANHTDDAQAPNDVRADSGAEDVVVMEDAAQERDVEPDLPSADMGGGDDGGDDTDGKCAFGDPGDADKERVVMIGLPFTNDVEVRGTHVQTLTLSADGTLLNEGVTLDVGFRVARIEFAPSGALALVLGEDGELASLSVDGPMNVAVVDGVSMPSADYGDLALSADGETLSVVGLNVAETSGVSVVSVACDGGLTVEEDGFLNVRLAQSMALLPGEERAVLLGGQATFEPVDPNDLRLLARDGAGWREVGAFDVFDDFIDASRIGLSPDGQLLLIPNGSPFSEDGDQVSVVAVEDDTLREVERLTDMPDVREAYFRPDGRNIVLTLLEPGQVKILVREGEDVAVSQTVRGVGLVEQMAPIERGALDGLMLFSSIDPIEGASSNIAMLRFTGLGEVEDLGQLNLGEELRHIPGAIAVQP